MQYLILYIAGLLIAGLIFYAFIMKRLPKQASVKDMIDEIMNETLYDSEENNGENEEINDGE
jgi:hypothetical protein